LRPDNTFAITIDDEIKTEGHLEDFFEFLPSKTIKDPSAAKPTDWVDEAEIDDPTDSKPDDWPERYIPDPNANKPSDWIDEEDGEWEAP